MQTEALLPYAGRPGQRDESRHTLTRSMPIHLPRLGRSGFLRVAVLAAAVFAVSAPPLHAYSVLTHEEVVDLAWKDHMVPLLRARFPGITDEQLKEAHAYAYGGCVLQDMGYYPHGSKLFSDLTHYVRTGDFVEQLINDATTPDELAFGLGALAHYTSDEVGHPYINKVEGMEFPVIRRKFDSHITYEDSPSHHIRTEFGFDVVGIAKNRFTPENYRDFIGFDVAKPLWERAFQQTYGIPLHDVVKDEDRSIGSARWAVHSLIPEMTKVALASYGKDIANANPGFQRKQYVYRLRRSDYEKKWGKDYQGIGFGARLLAFVVKILPKIGPLKDLRIAVPNGDEQAMYLKSVNQTVTLLDQRVDAMTARATPLPLPTEAASDAKKPDAGTAGAPPTASTPKEQKQQEKAETHAPDLRPQEKTASPDPAKLPKAANPNAQPTPLAPDLAQVNLDTGKPVTPGAYRLSDRAYADLLQKLVTDQPPPHISERLAGNIEQYFASPDSERGLKKKQRQEVASDLSHLRQMEETR